MDCLYDNESTVLDSYNLPNNNRVVTEHRGQCIVKYEIDEAGVKDGHYQLWNESGDYYECSLYSKGKLIQLYEEWLNDGCVCGLHKSWHSNGMLKMEFNTIDGERDGVFEEYNDKGQLLLSCIYKNGVLIGA